MIFIDFTQNMPLSLVLLIWFFYSFLMLLLCERAQFVCDCVSICMRMSPFVICFVVVYKASWSGLRLLLCVFANTTTFADLNFVCLCFQCKGQLHCLDKSKAHTNANTHWERERKRNSSFSIGFIAFCAIFNCSLITHKYSIWFYLCFLCDFLLAWHTWCSSTSSSLAAHHKLTFEAHCLYVDS